ncbi:hypothetical protein FOXG_16248 [Fusarium oxysporum f. sp. lycopersici 4287]|uniref:Uncharacterized protein n=3 Tax=Fusarium oxysporum TaxID=5507 RepID=A0A0J9WV32_FUSO4|nr:hypothetical protein FOXG_06880 [Fusarium oxysporum f. sp. lycopersici 4287]XP_018256719.1 hypothetical protein FOXG_16130 [Fusarium oxysporum f. sp. lycopersici 4287]XP_018256872.1 hypothetical protein FOXG_16248 [Fusarium oxysporum f. sp. lycopersici 4287]EXK24164.1 hypothetical protein FOMG_19094 [Fusarium oxysporum f. sp. melonis 26406]KAJ9419071.1 hypothetical protein QL093DRAFT_2353483 [Fusarium oxysporum]KNB04875.1 hypothetical protein FOXG_06880 [Fusarium oxysporum f. sp. lycopersic
MAITRSSGNPSSRSSLTKVELYHTHNGPSANSFSSISTELRQQQQCYPKGRRRSERIVALTSARARPTRSSGKLPAIPTNSVVDPSQAKSRRVQKSDLSQRHKPSCKPSSKYRTQHYTMVLNSLNIVLIRYANIILDKWEILDVLGRHSSYESQHRADLATAATQTFNYFTKHFGNMVANDRPKLYEHAIIQRLNEIVLSRTGGKEVTGMRAGMMVRYAEY